jgi:ABC-type multidrug transport system ATPase subunit
MIRIHDVCKRFGRTLAVDAVSLDIAAGDSVALWGVNGAGKTTLIRCVLGLLAFEGSISVAGCDVRREGKQARMMIGYVPQELGFYDDLRVAEAVIFFARLKRVSVGSAASILEEVGLLAHSRKRIRELSGGMKQRLALAIAMLGDPPVLVLDEVTASLDAYGRTDFVHLLSRLSGAGRTMLFASHRVEEIAALAKRVVVLDQGKASAVTSVPEFVAHLGVGTMLHLSIKSVDRKSAMEVLQVNGFVPHANGVGIQVPVHPDQKAGPLRVLAEARIAVDDFELVSCSQAPIAGSGQ